ncbi:MAG: hypothetical protein J3K34DRAFT_409041 [Monoraphidium minutum]|nr:MAG: hypothetical protein J3K34DRAFT_409041 [Monoraphidium minutum]
MHVLVDAHGVMRPGRRPRRLQRLHHRALPPAGARPGLGRGRRDPGRLLPGVHGLHRADAGPVITFRVLHLCRRWRRCQRSIPGQRPGQVWVAHLQERPPHHDLRPPGGRQHVGVCPGVPLVPLGGVRRHRAAGRLCGRGRGARVARRARQPQRPGRLDLAVVGQDDVCAHARRRPPDLGLPHHLPGIRFHGDGDGLHVHGDIRQQPNRGPAEAPHPRQGRHRAARRGGGHVGRLHGDAQEPPRHRRQGPPVGV